MQVEIPTSNGKVLHGTLQKEKREEPLVVVCHGYQIDSKHPALIAVVGGLNKQGHTTFTFDFSEGSELNLSQQVDDIQSIVNYFEDYKEVVVLSPSFAALTAAMTVVKTPKIKGLVTVNGFFGSDKLGSKYSRPYKVFRLLTFINPSHRKVWRIYKAGYRPQDISIPVLVIHSKTDEIVSHIQSEEFYSKLAGPKELKLLNDIKHHLTTDNARTQITHLIDSWLQRIEF